MVYQTEFKLKARSRGCHLVTNEVLSALPPLPKCGILNLFIKHTSAALSINENADPDVRHDLDAALNDIVRERKSYYMHTLEGDDDMPAHIKASLIGCSLSIPITNAKLNMGIWQGIYLCEFRNNASARSIVATITE